MALAVVRVRPLTAERGLGTTLLEAIFSDNRTIRFRVLSRDPAAVQAIGIVAPEHERAIEAWLDTQSGPEAA